MKKKRFEKAPPLESGEGSLPHAVSMVNIVTWRVPTIQRGGGVVGGGVEGVQHLLAPGGEAVLGLHALEELQQLVLVLRPLAPHQVLVTGEGGGGREENKTTLGIEKQRTNPIQIPPRYSALVQHKVLIIFWIGRGYCLSVCSLAHLHPSLPPPLK